MRHKAVVAVLLVLLVTLAVAFAVYAAWQEAKTTYAFGIVVEPSGAGTFRVVSTYCGEAIAGSTDNGCYISVENESSSSIFMDDWSVSSSRSDVTVRKNDPFNRCIDYDSTGYLSFYWDLASDAALGPVTFTAVVTASEGCP